MMNATMLKLALTSVGKVPPIEIDEETGETVIKGRESDDLVTKAKFGIVETVAVVALVFGCLAIFFSPFIVADFMGASLFVLAPIVAAQKHKLRSLGGFRGQHNRLREQVGHLHMENEKLHTSVEEFSKQTTALAQVEADLGKVAVSSGKSVDKLVSIVEENGKLQKEILENLNAEVLEQILTAVLQTDHNRDFVLNPRELEVLVMRLKNLPGVVFDEAAFRTFIKSDEGELTLSDVCNIARNLRDSTQTMVQSEMIVDSQQSRGLFSPPPPSSRKKRLFSPSPKTESPSIEYTNNTAASPDVRFLQYSPRDILKNKRWF